MLGVSFPEWCWLSVFTPICICTRITLSISSLAVASLGGFTSLGAAVRTLMVVTQGEEPLLLQWKSPREGRDCSHDLLQSALEGHIRAWPVALQFGKVRLYSSQKTTED